MVVDGVVELLPPVPVSVVEVPTLSVVVEVVGGLQSFEVSDVDGTSGFQSPLSNVEEAGLGFQAPEFWVVEMGSGFHAPELSVVEAGLGFEAPGLSVVEGLHAPLSLLVKVGDFSVEGASVVGMGADPTFRHCDGCDGGGFALFHSATGTIGGGDGTVYPFSPSFSTSMRTSFLPHTP